MGATAEPRSKQEFDVDLSRKSFENVDRIGGGKPSAWFSDPGYYKTVLGGEGEEANKLHELLGKYLKATDPKDKGVYRQQIITAYWYLASKLALHSIGAQRLCSRKWPSASPPYSRPYSRPRWPRPSIGSSSRRRSTSRSTTSTSGCAPWRPAW